MALKALVLLSSGNEELETVAVIDVLRRANFDVVVATCAATLDPVVCSRNVLLVPEQKLAEAKGTKHDIVVLPGGMNAARFFASSTEVGEVLKAQATDNRYVGAICASTVAILAHGIYKDSLVTSHPCVKEEIESSGFYRYSEDRVVVDAKLITSRGPGTAVEFALQIVATLDSVEKAATLRTQMLTP